MSEPNTVHDYVEDMRGMVGEAKTVSEILSKVRPLSEKLFNNRDAWIKPEHYEVDKLRGLVNTSCTRKTITIWFLPPASNQVGLRRCMITEPGQWLPGSTGERKMQSISAPTMHLSQTMARFNYAAISLSDKAT